MTAGPIGEAHILISPDFRGFGARLKTELSAAVRAVNIPAVKIQFDIHKGSLTKAIAEANKILKASGVKAKIEFDLNRGSLNRTIAQAKAAARGAGVKAKVDVDDGGSISRTTRGFDLLGGRGRSALRSLNREVFNSNIRLREMANILGGATLPVLVSLASVGVAAFGSLAAAAASAAAAIAVLPGLIAAAVQGASVIGLAFSGIGDAVKAMGAAQTQAGRGAVSSARQQTSAANSIRDAQQALGRASREAALANEDATRRVRDATRNLADSQREARQAQLDLNQSRRDARDGLVDLRLEESRLALDIREAALSRAEAEAELQRVTVSPTATALERQRAQLRAEQARLAERDIRRRIELNRREIRQGVEGSDQVRSARERLAGTNERTRDAARGVADAEREAARQRVQSAEQVIDAQRRLADAQLAAAAASTAAAGGVDKLGEAMSKLSPPAQRFARFLFSLKPRLDALKATAAAGFLPGLEDGIRRLVGAHFPALRRIVDATAKTLGNLAVEGAKMMSTGPWRKDFETIGRDNVRLIDQFGHVGLNLADALRNIMIAARPLTKAIGDMALKWSENTRASAQAGRDSGKLGKFFERVKTIVVSLLKIIGNVGATIGAVFSAALPSGAGLLVSLEKATDKMRELATSTEGRQNLKEFFDKARPAIETIGGLIVTLARKLFEVVVHVKNATEAIAGFLERNPQLKEFVGSALALAFAFKLLNVGGLVGIIGSLGQLVAFSLPLALVAGAVLALGAAFTIAYASNKPFRDGVNSLARTIADAVLPALRSFGGFITGQVIPALQRAIPFVRDQLVGGLDFLQQALKDNKPQLQILGRLLLEIGKFIAVSVIPFLFKLWAVHLRGLFIALGVAAGALGLLTRVFKAMVIGVLAGFQVILDGAASAFGWIPGIGGKLKGARDAFKTFRDKVAGYLSDGPGGIPNRNVIVTARGVFKAPKGIVQLPGGGGDFSTKANNRAKGGPIFGPGTGTSDDVPIWASHGEHVWTAAEVARAGGHHVMEAWRRSVRGYASGGAVEDAPRGRFQVTPRLSTSGLEEGLAGFGRNIDRFALALGKNLGATLFGASGGASGATSGAKFGGAAMTYIANFIRQAGVAFQVISGFRPGARTRGTGSVSLHALGRALDLVGAGSSSMLDIWRAATRIPFKKEVIFSPAPFQVYGSGKHPGPPSNPRTRADHYNHVHVGLFDRGGFLMPGLTLAENRTGRPERVQPATRDATGRLAFGGQGTHIENLIVQPLAGRFRMADVMTELRLQGVH